ncbi:MAG: hypothetical protein SNJ77_04095 [Cytophagales bacterium]
MRFWIWVCGLFIAIAVHAEEIKDTLKLEEKSDTSDFYKKLEIWSSKRKLTKWIFKTVIVSESISPIEETMEIDHFSTFIEHAGKRINNVRIKILPPFGNDVSSPDVKTVNKKTNFQNSLHIKTLKPIAKMFCLLKEGDLFDPEKAKETERLLRDNEFIRDAKVHLFPNDSLGEIDLMVVIQDVWSFVIEADGDLNQGRANISEKNLLGLGHFVSYRERYSYQVEKGLESLNQEAREFNYIIPNILNTFTSLNADYRSINQFESKSLSLNRPFFSPLTKTSYGAFLNENEFLFSRSYGDTGISNPFTKIQRWGVFVGKSFSLSKKSGIYTDRLISYLTYNNINHLQSPGLEYDTLYILQNRQEFIFSIGLTKRNFYKERYLFELGRVEDIPIGRSFNLVGGRIIGEIKNFDYTGFEYQFSNRSHTLGHIAIYGAYGKFFGWSNYLREYQRLRVIYFTPIFGKNKGWAFRQIVNFQYLNGIGALPNETADINRYGNFFGVGSSFLSHSSNLVLNYQTIIFSPVKWIGFNIVPVFFGSTAWTSEKNKNLISKQPLQVLGLGLRIKNDRIATSLIQISFGYLFGNPQLMNQSMLINPSNILQNNLKDLQVDKPGFVTLN